MKKFKNMVTEAITDVHVQKARDIAQLKHLGQIRKFDKKDYFIHPSRVANTVKRLTNNKELQIIAYLHDTIEDTKTSFEEIEAIFGTKIANNVKELTSIPRGIEKYGKEKHLIWKMNKMSDEALIVKLSDRLDNVSDFPTAPKNFVDKYRLQTKNILSGLKRPLNSTHKKIIKAIEDKL